MHVNQSFHHDLRKNILNHEYINSSVFTYFYAADDFNCDWMDGIYTVIRKLNVGKLLIIILKNSRKIGKVQERIVFSMISKN